MTKKICRLCLATITKNYQTIGEPTLKCLKLNPSISRETVICTECANSLEVFHNLKPARAYMRGSTLPLTDQKNEVNLETGIKCNFCAQVSGRGGLVSLNDSKEIESLVNLLQQHIPEMNIEESEEFLTCEICLSTLRDLFSFISRCLEVEEKINKYTETEGTDDRGQIELKDVQQFVIIPTVKSEIGRCGGNEVRESCDQFQEKFSRPTVATTKCERETNNSETTIIKTECVDVKSETIIKTEDVDVKSEHSESESFRGSVVEYKIAEEPLEISTLASEKRPKKYSKKNMFKCETCSYQSKYKRHVKLHSLNHRSSSEITMFKCELCSYQAKRKEYLHRHLLAHKTPSEVRTFKCELCPYRAKRKEYLQKHSLTHKPSSEVPTFKCQSCSFQTKHKESLARHLLTHKSLSEVTMLKCELCSYETKSRDCLRHHLLTHKSPSEIKMFKCEMCTYESKRRLNLQRHVSLTHNSSSENIFKCELCPFNTIHKYYLDRHLSTHKGVSESVFKCELCSFNTTCEYYLKKHLFRHRNPSEIKMFKCEVCPFEAKFKYERDRHVVTHSLERTIFKCALCSFSTKGKNYLKKHLLTHKGP